MGSQAAGRTTAVSFRAALMLEKMSSLHEGQVGSTQHTSRITEAASRWWVSAPGAEQVFPVTLTAVGALRISSTSSQD